VLFFPSSADQKPEAIVKAAIEDARKSYVDVLIVDTAGRTSIDEADDDRDQGACMAR
jgi:signal recognition particle subunit SRP54